MPHLSRTTPLFLALGLLILGPALAQWVPTGRAGTPPDGSEAVEVCTGNQVRTIDARTIETDGVAVLADGRCQLELTNVELTSSDGVALVVRGQARVVIQDSKIEGGEAAVAMDGSGVIAADRTEFWGGFLLDGNGFEFEDGELNQFSPRTELWSTADGP